MSIPSETDPRTQNEEPVTYSGERLYQFAVSILDNIDPNGEIGEMSGTLDHDKGQLVVSFWNARVNLMSGRGKYRSYVKRCHKNCRPWVGPFDYLKTTSIGPTV